MLLITGTELRDKEAELIPLHAGYHGQYMSQGGTKRSVTKKMNNAQLQS